MDYLQKKTNENFTCDEACKVSIVLVGFPFDTKIGYCFQFLVWRLPHTCSSILMSSKYDY